MNGDAFSLRREWMDSRKQVVRAIDEAKDAVMEFARAEHDYQVAKSKTAVAMRMCGEPATQISNCLKGNEDVVDLLTARNEAEGMQKIAIKAIDYYIQDNRQIFKEYDRCMGESPVR